MCVFFLYISAYFQIEWVGYYQALDVHYIIKNGARHGGR
jgi:hypothetical protein